VQDSPLPVDDQDAELTRIRRAIEALDRSLLALLRERQLLGQQAARAKIAAAVPLRDPLREAVVLRRARETAAELGLDTHQSERLYRLIIEMSVSQQQSHLLELDTVPLRVAFLGVEGSPGQVAAQARYGVRTGGALLEGHTALADAVESVRSGRADVALLPLESTLEGSTRTMDLVSEAGLVISGEQIHRDGEHYTRYVELAREAPAVPEDVSCKTSVILTLADRTGALDEVLQAFSRQGVNLTRIESRPMPGSPPRFRFFVDMEGHAAGDRVSRALEGARAHAEVRVVGSYPAYRAEG
jgi:prephenate dehydratase/chorismate mutase